MTLSGRLALVFGLSLALIATDRAGGALDSWLRQLLAPSAYRLSLAHALRYTAECAVWLMPLLFFPKLRDVGSFRLPWSWTVLILVPALALNLVFYGRFPTIPWQPACGLVWMGLAIGVFEELVFRGYAFRNSPERQAGQVVIISAVLFMALHLLNLRHQSLPMVLASLPFVFALGVGFGIVRIVTGSLAWCMLLHGAVDAVNQFAKPIHPTNPWFHLSWGIMVTGAVLTLCLHPKFRGSRSGDMSTKCDRAVR